MKLGSKVSNSQAQAGVVVSVNAVKPAVSEKLTRIKRIHGRELLVTKNVIVLLPKVRKPVQVVIFLVNSKLLLEKAEHRTGLAVDVIHAVLKKTGILKNVLGADAFGHRMEQRRETKHGILLMLHAMLLGDILHAVTNTGRHKTVSLEKTTLPGISKRLEHVSVTVRKTHKAKMVMRAVIKLTVLRAAKKTITLVLEKIAVELIEKLHVAEMDRPVRGEPRIIIRQREEHGMPLREALKSYAVTPRIYPVPAAALAPAAWNRNYMLHRVSTIQNVREIASHKKKLQNKTKWRFARTRKLVIRAHAV